MGKEKGLSFDRVTAAVLASVIVLAFFSSPVVADEVRVMISGGLSNAYNELEPQLEARSRDRLITVYGPSMGTTINAIPVRLARGECADVIIAARSAIDKLSADGVIDRQSEIDLVRSPIGLAVKSGSPIPNISTVDDFKQTLLSARSIAYSDSASGEYVSSKLFARLGIEEKVQQKATKIEATPVGEIVAAGKAEIGFQQMSELLPIHGIRVVGAIPQAVQQITVFSAGITKNSEHRDGARRLIEKLISASARPTLIRNGLEPVH